MSRALFSTRARYALDPLASSPTCKSLRFSLVSTTRRLHVHAETAPFTFHHVPEGGRRLTTPTSSPDTFSSLSQHLNQTFPPLKFSPELAQRILTHISHRDSLIGHNSRFSFLGRRTLEAYLLLFLQGLPVAAEHDHARIADRVLNTHSLGEHVAPHWRLLDVMRWVSPLAGQPGLDGREAGQYKVAGTTVEAIVGGILHQFGGSVAHRLFHTRVLPQLLLPGSPFGLPDVLHADALKAAKHYGGLEGSLLVQSSQTS
ncbi:ribonuclease-III-like-domain-containing protein [Lactifluus volemus]|nr:ribonuclease-III-like-domain-containing protein [Lactifluus volemus]